MPPLLSNNHWLMIIMVLFTWHQIGQTINVSSSPSTLLNDNKPSSVPTINKTSDFRLDNKLESNLDHKLAILSTSENKSSNLFLSTTSSLSTQLTSSSIDNLNDKKIINSTLSNESNGSKNEKNISELNLNKYNQRMHFDSIHGGFSLINSTFINVSSFAAKKENDKNLKAEKITLNIENGTSLNTEQQIKKQTTLSTPLNGSLLNSKHSTLPVSTSFPDKSNAQYSTKIIVNFTENSSKVLKGNSTLNSIILSNESTKVQEQTLTMNNRTTSTKETTPSTKLSSSIDSTNKRTKLNSEHSESSTQSTFSTLLDHQFKQNRSKTESSKDDSLTKDNSLNQFKNVIKKDDKDKESLKRNDQEAASSGEMEINLEEKDNDKLCLEDDGWPTTECSDSSVSNCTYPYTGLIYRLCYSSCQWSKVDTSQCKLAHLAEIHNLILYHIHKHLVDGLYPLVEELSKVICSSSSPILNPVDRIDAFDALNSIFNSVALNLHLDPQEPEQKERELNFVKSIFKVTDSLVTNRIVFESETEKNSLITFKITESLLGLRALIESLTRALIVQNEQNSIYNKVDRQVSLLNSESNLVLMLIHRTRAGKLLTLFTNELQHPGATNRLPHTSLHLEEELKDVDAGIAILSINNLQKGGYSQSGKWKILSNPLLVTFLPAISIAATFEQTPTVNVEFTFLDNFVPLSQPVFCVRLANSSKNSWTRSKCVLVRRNTTSAQCACSVIGYLAVVSTRGTGGQLGRIETDAFGNVHYHQSYVSKLHKPLLIGSAASSLLILLILAFSLSSNLFRNSRSNRRQFINSIDQLDRSIKYENESKQDEKVEVLNNETFNDKTFNQVQKEDSISLKELKELDKQISRQKTFNSQYCSQTKLNWLILISLFACIQLFWCTGVLFPGDEYTIYRLWKKLISKYRSQTVPKPIYISSSWTMNPQVQQVNHLVTSFADSQQHCLNVGLILHFLFISCNIWMILNSFHLYQHLKRSKFNDFKFDLFFNYSSNRFPFSCCSFNYAKSTENLISKQQQSISTSDRNSINDSTNQISSIEQLVEEINQKDNDRRESGENRSGHQTADNLIKRKNNSENNRNCPISFSPSKMPKRRALGQLLGQRLNNFIRQIKRHLSTFAYYSITWFVASFITILTYKLNPAGYETKRYCWMSIEGGITISFIVPVSFFIILNTVLILLALRHYLYLQRVHQQLNKTSPVFNSHELVNNHSQFKCINKMCKFNFIFRSTYFNINLFVSCLPAFAVYWFFTVLALEQQNTAVFQFIFAILNFLFSCCLLLVHLPYVKQEFNFISNRRDYLPEDQLIKNDFSDVLIPEDFIDEELIVCVDYDES